MAIHARKIETMEDMDRVLRLTELSARREMLQAELARVNAEELAEADALGIPRGVPVEWDRKTRTYSWEVPGPRGAVAVPANGRLPENTEK